MTSKSDSSSVLRRDLNNLKYKRERMAVKIKELQVEMKLIDEKIKALEDDLSAESNKPSSSSIDATISNVIDSVMKSAASKSSTTNQHTSNNHKSKSVITTINGNHSLCNTKTSTTANNSSSSNSSMTNRSKSSTSSPSSPSSIVRATSSSLSSSSVSQKSMPVRKSSSDSSNYSRLAKSLNTASQSATGDMITPARHHGDIVGSRIPVIDSQANRNPFVTTFAVPQHLPPPPIMNDSNNWNWMAQPFVPSTSVSMSTEPHFNNWYMDREMHHHQALLTHNTSLLQPHSPQNVHRQPIHSSVSFYHAPTSATCASFETPIRPLAQMVPPVIAPTPASPVTSNPVATAQNTYHSSNKSHSVDHSDRCQSSGSSNDPAEGHEHDKITFQTLPLAFEECITLLEPQIISNHSNCTGITDLKLINKFFFFFCLNSKYLQYSTTNVAHSSAHSKEVRDRFALLHLQASKVATVRSCGSSRIDQRQQ